MAIYPPPSFIEYIPIFNPIDWETTAEGGITIAYLNAHYLKYPVAQGLETLNGMINLGDTTLNTNLIMSGTALTNYIQFPDATKQYTASTFSPLSPSPAGIYTNLNATINSYGQITTASNGTATPTSFTIPSNAIGANSWTFTIPISYGRAFSYSIYTDIQPTGTTTANVAKPMNGYPAINGTFFYATGSGILQKYTSTSVNAITYCSGFQADYTISASGNAYIMSIINSMGTTFTWSYSTNSVNDNTACPPKANSNFTTTYTLTSTGSVPTCFVKLVGIVIAS